MARNVPAADRLWALLHDATEAYLVDVPRPVKPLLPDYKELEQTVMAAVAEAFGLEGAMPPSVKRADNAILADEAAQIMGAPPIEWGLTEPPLGIKVHCWTPRRARNAFLAAFADYATN